MCVSQAQQMTMQAIAIQQQMLSSFPPVAPAPQSPPSQPYAYSQQRSHTQSPVSSNSRYLQCTSHHLPACAQVRNTNLNLSVDVFFCRRKKVKSHHTSNVLLLFNGKRVCFTLWLSLDGCMVDFKPKSAESWDISKKFSELLPGTKLKVSFNEFLGD